VDTIGDVCPRPSDGRRGNNLAQVALLGRALHVVSRLHDRHIQILEVGVEVGEADGGGVLERAVRLAPALHRRHSCGSPPPPPPPRLANFGVVSLSLSLSLSRTRRSIRFLVEGFFVFACQNSPTPGSEEEEGVEEGV
jgi:hypothetical protein